MTNEERNMLFVQLQEIRRGLEDLCVLKSEDWEVRPIRGMFEVVKDQIKVLRQRHVQSIPSN